MKNSANRFKLGSGVYTCRCCERKTRDTGGDGSMVGNCDICYDLAGYQNMIWDNNIDSITKSDIENILCMVDSIYSRGGVRYWDDLLEDIAKICKERAATESL